MNDINLAALGEKHFGVGKEADSLIFFWAGFDVSSKKTSPKREYSPPMMAASTSGQESPARRFLQRVIGNREDPLFPFRPRAGIDIFNPLALR